MALSLDKMISHPMARDLDKLISHPELRGLVSTAIVNGDDYTVRAMILDWLDEHAANTGKDEDRFRARMWRIQLAWYGQEEKEIANGVMGEREALSRTTHLGLNTYLAFRWRQIEFYPVNALAAFYAMRNLIIGKIENSGMRVTAGTFYNGTTDLVRNYYAFRHEFMYLYDVAELPEWSNERIYTLPEMMSIGLWGPYSRLTETFRIIQTRIERATMRYLADFQRQTSVKIESDRIDTIVENQNFRSFLMDHYDDFVNAGQPINRVPPFDFLGEVDNHPRRSTNSGAAENFYSPYSPLTPAERFHLLYGILPQSGDDEDVD